MDFQFTESILNYLSQILDGILEKLFGHRMGFALLIFEFDKPNASNCIGNSQKEDIIKSLEVTAKRLKNNEDIPFTIGGMQ